MKNYLKRIFSVVLAAMLILGSLTGIKWIAGAESTAAVSSNGLEFSTDRTGGTYLKLEKPLNSVPAKIEATVNKTVEEPEWQLVDGNEEYKNGINNNNTFTYSHVTIENDTVTEEQPNSAEIAGSDYIKVATTSNATFSIVKNLSPSVDLSKYSPEDLELDFWFYTSKGKTVFDGGWLLLSNGFEGFTGPNSKAAIGTSAANISKTLGIGWNHITIPLTAFSQQFNSGFTYSDIKCFKFNGVKTSEACVSGLTDVKIKVSGSAYSETDPSVNNYTIFSNYSANDSSVFALYLTENGFPALLYGDKQFVLKKNICNGKQVKIGATVEDDGYVSFYINGALAEKTSEKITSVISAPQTPHSIGADGSGNQCFNGIISDVRVFNSDNKVIGNWDLSMDSDKITESIEDLSGNNNKALFVKNQGREIAKIPFSYEKTIEGKGTNTATFWSGTAFGPIDASKADPARLELKMDIEIENLTTPGKISPFVYCEGQVELTSGGKPDTNEKSVNVNTLNFKNGKNEYTVSLSSGSATGGNIDYSAINYMRIYINNFNADFSDNIRLKIDNVRLIENYSAIPTLFSDGMILQQNKPMNLWGNGAYGEPVIATLKKGDTVLETKKTIVPEDGKWQLCFDKRKGGYDKYQIELTVGAEKRTINDVVIGELWLAGGQSNMELQVYKDIDAEKLIDGADNSNIRVFLEPTYPYGKNEKQPIQPKNDVPGAYWGYGNNPVNVGGMSSLAYTFAKQLQQKLDVPVGIINSAIGGTVIEGWLSKAAVDGDSEVKSKLKEYKLYYDETNWPDIAGKMSTLYNQKIGPLEGMNIAGVIWYQGESNGKYSEIYDLELDLLKRSWSKAFGYENGDMPFIFTQVAPYYHHTKTDDNQLGYLSMYMERAWRLSENKNTAMLTIYDLPLEHVKNGKSADPIHPRTKVPVGERFAQSALNMVYGGGKVYTAPVYKSAEVKDGAVYVTFDCTGNGLKAIGNSGDIHGFTVAGADGVYVNAKAQIIDKNTVKVWNDRVEDPKNVIYAFDNYNQSANLANSEGIPASPLRTVKLNDSTSKPDASVKYFNSQDWMNADKDAWVYDLDYTENDSRNTGYRPSFEVNGGTYSYDSEIKAEGEASLKVEHQGDFTLSPILKYENISKNWSNFKSFSFKTKVSSNAEIKLVIKSGDNEYEVSAAGGKDSVLTAPTESFKTLTFDLTSLKLNGQPVIDAAAVLNAVSSVMIQVKAKDGEAYFDEFMFGMNSKADRTEEINEVTDSVNGFNIKTVKATDKEKLNSLSEKADELIKDNDVKESDKAKLQEAKTNITRLLSRIEDAENALKTENITKTALIDSDTVKLSDKAAVSGAADELKAVLNGDYADNYTDSQRTSINNDIDRLETALKTVKKAEMTIEQAKELPELSKVKLNDKEAIDSLKNKIALLTENEKALVGTDILDEVNKLYERVSELYNISHSPKITEGADAKWDPKNSVSVIFRSNADFSEFIKVLIDGNELDTKYYKASSGSTVIELYSDYLRTLSVGEHSISIVSLNGHADTVFTVLSGNTVNNESGKDNTQNNTGKDNDGKKENNSEQTVSPKTGDVQKVELFAVLTVVSLSALAILARKRQKKNG